MLATCCQSAIPPQVAARASPAHESEVWGPRLGNYASKLPRTRHCMQLMDLGKRDLGKRAPPQHSLLVVPIAAASQHPRRDSCVWFDWSHVASDPPFALSSRSSTTWSSSLLLVLEPPPRHHQS